MQKSILVINGPGFTDLGGQVSDLHEGVTLAAIRSACQALCDDLGIKLDFRQTEDSQEMLGWLAKGSKQADALVVNPATAARAEVVDFDAYCEAIYQLAQAQQAIIEVHLSNIYGSHDAQFPRPHHKPGGAMGFIAGLGVDGYLLAIRSLAEKLQSK